MTIHIPNTPREKGLHWQGFYIGLWVGIIMTGIVTVLVGKFGWY